ncbi:hypothetical protein MOO44_00875 (plasmid) [Nicoliella spurrieriana]|uniref:Uncharacterized protein n=1 Tax=Nicoliella spurrieriana TaxID=2925830 RepID=A0A976RQV9_9LACO|nr:hypothetical protein [Nicoliella spurrieriana]UQS86225.1 hypothetical protein MOO44_00875 [Nicoliella spurrieriana]
MKKIKIEKTNFEYNEDDMTCFFDNGNKRAAFIRGDEIQLIIDLVDHEVVFHPDVRVNIYEIDDNSYRIESFY